MTPKSSHGSGSIIITDRNWGMVMGRITKKPEMDFADGVLQYGISSIALVFSILAVTTSRSGNFKPTQFVPAITYPDLQN